MGISTDFYKNEFVQEAMLYGQAKMLRGMLATKFGKPLPKWVDEKLAAANVTQVERWSIKLLRADTLEGVLGKP